MPAQFIDLNDHPTTRTDMEHIKRPLFNSDSFHSWIHADEPGTKGPMHRHTADQTFYCLKGECTFNFPDEPSTVLTPGMIVMIPKGEYYQLHNTGDGDMVMLGNRAEPYERPRFSLAGEQVPTSKPV